MSRPGARVSRILRARWAAAVVAAQVSAQLLVGVPVAAIQARPRPGVAAARSAPLPAPKVAVNRTVPKVAPPPSAPRFSADPTDEEITRARVFREALLPVGTTNPAENQALAAAIVAYHRDDGVSTTPFEAFLTAFRSTAWRPSLLVNLGRVARLRGEFSGALSRWEEAWRLTQDDRTRAGKTVADQAIGEVLGFAADLGHVPMLERYLALIGERPVSGPAGERVGVARATLRTLRLHPESVLSCGRQALAMLWPLVNSGGVPKELQTPGTSDVKLGDLQALAKRVGLDLAAVVRTGDAEPTVPSVVHLNIGHYAVLVRTDGQRYLLRDPGLGGEVWITKAALATELSGYTLVPGGSEHGAWRMVTSTEAETVEGRSLCPAGAPDPDQDCPCGGKPDPRTGRCCPTECSSSSGSPGSSPSSSGCGGGTCSAPGGGMPVYSLVHHSASLVLTDTPVGYAPSRGPAVFFTLRYNSRASFHPQVPVYGWLGPQWSHEWLAYAEESPAYCETGLSMTNYCFPAAVNLHVRGGGVERHRTPDANGVYPRSWWSNVQLVRVSAAPIRYERRLTSGGVEVYSLPDTAPAGQRRVFLTEVRDAHGQAVTLTYDAQYRLVALTDALGQVTTLAYEDGADPLRLTRVTDPFGRTAAFGYDGAGHLASLTDTLGLTSRMVYGDDGKVVLLATPYGTTSFRHGGDFYEPTLEVTDAAGGTERIEYRWDPDVWPASDPAAEVPPEFASSNTRLNTYTTVHWTPQAWAAAPGSLATATLTRWLSSAWAPYATVRTVGIPHSIKRPLERRIWYAYPNQPDEDFVGSHAEPTLTARVLDDGTVQRTQATYNEQGQVTSRTDSVGRQTTYVYAANGVDVLEVRQMKPGGYDVVAQYGNYTAGHRPQTVTDAAGQTTTFTYNAAGQALTATNAKQETTTYAYDAQGRLESVTGAVPEATTSYTYDGYGRTRTVTGPDGYVVTTDYDVFDRPTRVTYPDGTYDETTYDRLDVATRRDRLGRITRYYHDAFRRLAATRDPAGRTITQRWGAGGLSQLIDAKGQRTTWERDVQGRVTREVRADGLTATVYAYQPASGRLATVTDPKQQVTTYIYGADESVMSITYSNAVIPTPGVSYTYDPVYHRVATMVDGTGTTSYAYHPPGQLGAGQVASVDGPLTDDTITYTYDELERVVTRAVNGAANTTTQVYDALGRVTSETNVLGTFTYAYVGVTGRLELVSYPNGQTSEYAYYPVAQDLRLQTIHHKRPGGTTLSRFDYTYDAGGNIVTWQQQADNDAPTLWVYGYDAADQLTSAVHRTSDPTPAIIHRYAYTYDPAGNRTSEQIDDAVTVDTHDNLNRLLTKSPGGPLVFQGALSEPGQVTINGQPVPLTAANEFKGVASVAPGTNTVTINAVDASGNAATAVYEVDQSGAGRTFTYDANGNLTSDGTSTFEWDARNQLASVVIGTRRTEFVYDGRGRRVRLLVQTNGVVEIDRRLVWDGAAPLEERNGAGDVVTRRVYDKGEYVGVTRLFLGADHLGTVRDVTDSLGESAARYDSDPWGRRSLLVSGEYPTGSRYGGQFVADSEVPLWAATHRYYSPDLGRWVSEDPAGFVDGANLYPFVGNDPIGHRDPSGLQGIQAPGRIMDCAYNMGQFASRMVRGERNDKYQHCFVVCFITATCGAGAGAFAGVGDEIADVPNPNSTAEVDDLIADARGLMCGLKARDQKQCQVHCRAIYP